MNILNIGLKDLEKEIKKLSKKEIEIEKPDEIVRVVKMILDFNKQNQQKKQGIKVLTPNQMLNRLPIALAQLNVGINRCECKQLFDKGICNKGFILNLSNCRCECDKSCNTSQYLDYLDYKCKKKIDDLIVEECIEYDDDKTKIVNITVTKNDNQTKIVNKTVKNSCKMYIVLTIVAILISTVYTIYFVYYNWFFIKNKDFFIFYKILILVKKL